VENRGDLTTRHGRGGADRRHPTRIRNLSRSGGNDDDDIENLPGIDLADIDAVLARSNAAIDSATRPISPGNRATEKDPLLL
jgi:hypothetical protein